MSEPFQVEAVGRMLALERGAANGSGPAGVVSRVGVLANARGSGKTHVVSRLLQLTEDHILPTHLSHARPEADASWYVRAPPPQHDCPLVRCTMILCPPHLARRWRDTLRIHNTGGNVRILDVGDVRPIIKHLQGGIVVVPAIESALVFLRQLVPWVLGRLVIDEPAYVLGIVPQVMHPHILRARFMWLLAADACDLGGVVRLAADAMPLRQLVSAFTSHTSQGPVISRLVMAHVVQTTVPPPAVPPPFFLRIRQARFSRCPAFARDRDPDDCQCIVCRSRALVAPLDPDAFWKSSASEDLKRRAARRLGIAPEPPLPPDGVSCIVCMRNLLNPAAVATGADRAGTPELMRLCGSCAVPLCLACAARCGPACPHCRTTDTQPLHVPNWIGEPLPTLKQAISAVVSQARADGERLDVLVILETRRDMAEVMTSLHLTDGVRTVYPGLDMSWGSLPHSCTVWIVGSMREAWGLDVTFTHVVSTTHDPPDIRSLVRRPHYARDAYSFPTTFISLRNVAPPSPPQE